MTGADAIVSEMWQWVALVMTDYGQLVAIPVFVAGIGVVAMLVARAWQK